MFVPWRMVKKRNNTGNMFCVLLLEPRRNGEQVNSEVERREMRKREKCQESSDLQSKMKIQRMRYSSTP